ESTIRTGHLIPVFGTAAHTEITEVARITLRSDFQVEHPLGVSRAVASYIGHIAIVIDNLYFLDDICRKVFDRSLDITTEEVLPIDPCPRHRLTLCCHITIRVHFHAIQSLQRIAHQGTV